MINSGLYKFRVENFNAIAEPIEPNYSSFINHAVFELTAKLNKQVELDILKGLDYFSLKLLQSSVRAEIKKRKTSAV